MGPPPSGMPKDQFAAGLRQRIRDDNTLGVVHIAEAWIYVPRRAGDHTARQLEAGEMKVTELRREERTEALVVRYECRDGKQRCGSVLSSDPRPAAWRSGTPWRWGRRAKGGSPAYSSGLVPFWGRLGVGQGMRFMGAFSRLWSRVGSIMWRGASGHCLSSGSIS